MADSGVVVEGLSVAAGPKLKQVVTETVPGGFALGLGATGSASSGSTASAPVLGVDPTTGLLDLGGGGLRPWAVVGVKVLLDPGGKGGEVPGGCVRELEFKTMLAAWKVLWPDEEDPDFLLPEDYEEDDEESVNGSLVATDPETIDVFQRDKEDYLRCTGGRRGKSDSLSISSLGNETEEDEVNDSDEETCRKRRKRKGNRGGGVVDVQIVSIAPPMIDLNVEAQDEEDVAASMIGSLGGPIIGRILDGIGEVKVRVMVAGGGCGNGGDGGLYVDGRSGLRGGRCGSGGGGRMCGMFSGVDTISWVVYDGGGSDPAQQ